MDSLLNALLDPENQGSVYFANLIHYPSRTKMNMRKDLTRSVLRAFFRLLWGVPQHRIMSPSDVLRVQSRLKVVVPFGRQITTAMIQIRTDQCDRRVPLLAPTIADKSYALYYVDVSRSYHAHLAQWLSRYSKEVQVGDIRVYDAAMMARYMDQLESQQLIASLVLDDGNTTVFSVDIPSSCCSG